jgi:hypothetical protein
MSVEQLLDRKVTRRDVLEIIFPWTNVAHALVEQNLELISPATKLGLALESTLFLPGCAGIKIEEVNSFPNVPPNKNKIASAGSALMYFESTGNLTWSFSNDAIPIIENGELIGLSTTLPIATLIGSILFNPGVVQDTSEGNPQIWLNHNGKLIPHQLTQQETALIRAGCKIADYGKIDTPFEIRVNNITIAKAKDSEVHKPYAKLIVDKTGEHFVPSDPNWKPPKKDYCGENIPRFYALMVYDQILAILMVKSGIISDKPIVDKFSSDFLPEKEMITKRMKDKDCFFYKHGGSIFMDYKLMREQDIQGNLNKWSNDHGFDINSDPDEMMMEIEKYVNGWW